MNQPISGYATVVRVRFNECDPLGHLNNAVYLTYLEQIALDHAAAVGWDTRTLIDTMSAVFVAHKHEITYHRPAFENDLLLIRTWPVDLAGARAIRSYTVSHFRGNTKEWNDGLLPFEELPTVDAHDICVSAKTEFAFMNRDAGRPVRIPAEFRRSFFSEESD